MTRANIRYYERAGLLAPERRGNNYRDYSEDDLTALQRVRLLRELRVPVGEIARLQTGEAELGRVLEEQAEKLRAESGELSEAAALCRALREAGVSYAELDAERWLDRAQAPAGKPRGWQLRDLLPIEPGIWKRFLARTLDFLLVSSALSVLRLANRWPFSYEWWIVRRYAGWLGAADWFIAWRNALAACGVLLLLEPLLLCTVGTTFGKWVFGLRVRALDGGKLTFGRGLKRMWGVFTRGAGGMLPGYSLWRLWRSARTAGRGETLPWDGGLCCVEERRRRCGVWFALTNLACAAAVFLTFAHAALPRHTGDLTVRELTENCSQYMRQYRGDADRWMGEDGRWRSRRGQDGEPGGMGYHPPCRFETDERGIVTAVQIDHTERMTGKGTPYVPGYSGEAMYFAYVMAMSDVSPREILTLRDFHRLLPQLPDPLEDFTAEKGRVRITNRFTYIGYESRDGGEGWAEPCPIDGEEQYTRWELTCERIR